MNEPTRESNSRRLSVGPGSSPFRTWITLGVGLCAIGLVAAILVIRKHGASIQAGQHGALATLEGTIPAPAPSDEQLGAGLPSGRTLTSSEIGGTVEKNRAFVRTKCWQPALDASPKQGPANARIAAKLTVGAMGDVETVSAQGGESFPGLSDCIAAAVKNWKFPVVGAPTTVDVPFVFASQ